MGTRTAKNGNETIYFVIPTFARVKWLDFSKRIRIQDSNQTVQQYTILTVRVLHQCFPE